MFWGLLGLLVITRLAWWYLDPTPSGDGSPPTVLVVREGEGWNEVTDRLAAAGLVRRPLVFKVIVQVSGARGELLPGRYQLEKGTSSRDIISTLTDPENGATVTVPEGFRLEQIFERLQARGLATPEQWARAIESPPRSPVLESRPAGVGLEGYLYPGTYGFTEENAAQQMVAGAIQSLHERLTPTIRAQLAEQELTIHQALTIASIIEREAQVASERPIIASVYLNRYRMGMKLQADPTVQYAVGSAGDWWKAGLTRTDLRNPSPYNTYVHEGLPPGPIANPGIASIQAVAQPARTSYLYFVAKGDGTHAFAETYEDHQANIERYLRR